MPYHIISYHIVVSHIVLYSIISHCITPYRTIPYYTPTNRHSAARRRSVVGRVSADQSGRSEAAGGLGGSAAQLGQRVEAETLTLRPADGSVLVRSSEVKRHWRGSLGKSSQRVIWKGPRWRDAVQTCDVLKSPPVWVPTGAALRCLCSPDLCSRGTAADQTDVCCHACLCAGKRAKLRDERLKWCLPRPESPLCSPAADKKKKFTTNRQDNKNNHKQGRRIRKNSCSNDVP